MDCPSCGTYNPDDKIHCWRCGVALPKPREPKKSRRLSAQTWFWVAAILLFAVSTLVQCGFLRRGGGDDVGLLQMLGDGCRLLSMI
jgi:hypothetical protein